MSHPIRDLPDYDKRLEAARNRAAWEIGDPSWADKIIDAFANPDDDAERLAVEMT